MSLPPGFLDELRGRLSLSQVVGRKVTWDMRKSNQGKGDWWAPCPFHQEKTASFHVDDRKGYYYCFGCQAKGDAISFVRESENMGFIEAVGLLAGEAGLPMPERDPQAQAKSDRRSELIDVVEEAARWFRLQLKTAAGADARAYLARRGLSEAALERWQIGYAPPGWEGLRLALSGRGIDEAALLEAGLVRASDRGRKPYDTFRDRIIFPIRDTRDRAIAFGGRAMDPGESAKYLNSPETPLFDKGRTLYNMSKARSAAGSGAPLIVAEGYMDVIALSEAGFEAAVAPLGTAVSEDQLRLLWRVAPEPVVALDGDTAGLRAATRLVDLALPMLEPGRSLRFALLPSGRDPDDLIRAEGRAAMQAVIDGARPLVEMLWQKAVADRDLDSPERRAGLDRDLRQAIARIADPGVRQHYGQAIAARRRELFAPSTERRRWTKGRSEAAKPVRSSTKRSELAVPGGEDRLREAAILATLISTPQVIAEFDAELYRMDCADPDHRAMRDILLGAPDDPARSIVDTLGADVLEKLFAHRHVAITPAVRKPGDTDVARMSLAEELAKLSARRGHARELADAEEDLDTSADEGLTWRLGQAAAALRDPMPDGRDAAEDFETGPNGARLDRGERLAFEELLSRIGHGRGRGDGQS